MKQQVQILCSSASRRNKPIDDLNVLPVPAVTLGIFLIAHLSSHENNVLCERMEDVSSEVIAEEWELTAFVTLRPFLSKWLVVNLKSASM